jgi:hypothetical protein
MNHVDASGVFEKCPAEVVSAADATRRVRKLAGLGLRRGHDVLHGLEGRFVAHHQDQRAALDQHDRHKVVLGVVRDLLEQGLVDGERRKVAHADGVAVRPGLGDRIGADVAAGTGLVVDDDRLPQFLAHQPRQLARAVVGIAAGRVGADPRDELARVFVLSPSESGQQQRSRRGGHY